MADTKISGLTALTGANTASGDLLTIVDISDTTMAATGTNKNITLTELQSAPVSAGTANGVAYLNGSKVVTTGSALTFDGTNFGISAGSGVSVKNISSATQANLRLGSTFTTGTGGANTDWSLIQSYAVYGDLVFRSGTAEGGDPRTTGSTRFQFLRDGTSIWSVAGSEAMRLTSTGLGIGTSSPGYKLQVNGDSYFRGLAYFGVGAGCYIDGSTSTAGYKLYVWDNASSYVQRMTVDSSGNLGLGVTPSAWGSAYKIMETLGGSVGGNTAGLMTIHQNAYNNAGWKYRNSLPASIYEQSAGSHVWYNAPSGTAGNAITFTQAMTLDASGNLGIGVTTLGNKLEVNGGINMAAATATVPSYGMMVASGVGTQITSALHTAFYNNGSERARIDSNGRVLINTTTADTNYRVRIDGNIASSSPLRCTMDSTSAATQVGFFNPNGAVGSISTSGTTTSYNTSSDYRLKENVQPMTGALAKVASLKPCTYNWKVDGSDGEGFIAHELAEVVPQCVTGEKDAVDADGNPVYQGIDTSFLVATLTAAIKELKAEFDAYKATHP